MQSASLWHGVLPLEVESVGTFMEQYPGALQFLGAGPHAEGGKLDLSPPNPSFFFKLVLLFSLKYIYKMIILTPIPINASNENILNILLDNKYD
jgi:hypothetical protein